MGQVSNLSSSVGQCGDGYVWEILWVTFFIFTVLVDSDMMAMLELRVSN